MFPYRIVYFFVYSQARLERFRVPVKKKFGSLNNHGYAKGKKGSKTQSVVINMITRHITNDLSMILPRKTKSYAKYSVFSLPSGSPGPRVLPPPPFLLAIVFF